MPTADEKLGLISEKVKRAEKQLADLKVAQDRFRASDAIRPLVLTLPARRFLPVQTFRLVAWFLACTVIAAAQSNNGPDDAYKIGQTLFGYNQSENKTTVMSNAITVLDNSRSGFQYVDGAQRVELYLMYEFKGRELTEEATALTMTFESRSSAPRFNSPAARSFELIADGDTIIRTTVVLDKSTLIGYITWEQASVRVPVADFHKLLMARKDVGFRLGAIQHPLTDEELAISNDFAKALRPRSATDWHTPWFACSLLDDIPGMRTRGYMKDPSLPKDYWCSSPYKEIGTGTVFSIANNLAYYATGDQRTARQLKLVLNVNSLHAANVGHEALAIASRLLTRRALNADLSNEVLTALLSGRPGKWNAGKSQIEVLRDDWSNGKGYEVHFIIR